MPTGPLAASHVDAQPLHPEPAVFVVPTEAMAGPGTVYPDSFAWMLTAIPGSLALYAPGKLTVAGFAVPVPPETESWKHVM